MNTCNIKLRTEEISNNTNTNILMTKPKTESIHINCISIK